MQNHTLQHRKLNHKTHANPELQPGSTRWNEMHTFKRGKNYFIKRNTKLKFIPQSSPRGSSNSDSTDAQTPRFLKPHGAIAPQFFHGETVRGPGNAGAGDNGGGSSSQHLSLHLQNSQEKVGEKWKGLFEEEKQWNAGTKQGVWRRRNQEVYIEEILSGNWKLNDVWSLCLSAGSWFCFSELK